MPRACSVCTHADRAALDQMLVEGRPLRETSALFRVSEDALGRHKAEHLPPTLAQPHGAAEAARAEDLLEQVRILRGKAIDLLRKAEAAGDYRTALAGVREARACVELLLEVEGELDRRPQVNVLLSAEWVSVRQALLAALAPYPEARAAVAARLVTMENRNGASH
jgi:hypothetical protein